MRAEMSVAGRLRQHRRELSVWVDLGEHGRKCGTEMVWGKKENLGILQHWLYGTSRWNQYAAIEDSRKHWTKSWKRAGFLCLATHGTTISCRSPITEYQWGTYEYCGDTWSSAKEHLTPVKEVSWVPLRWVGVSLDARHRQCLLV